MERPKFDKVTGAVHRAESTQQQALETFNNNCRQFANWIFEADYKVGLNGEFGHSSDGAKFLRIPVHESTFEGIESKFSKLPMERFRGILSGIPGFNDVRVVENGTICIHPASSVSRYIRIEPKQDDVTFTSGLDGHDPDEQLLIDKDRTFRVEAAIEFMNWFGSLMKERLENKLKRMQLHGVLMASGTASLLR